MAEDSGAEKTEQPTPKKLQDAAKKGQIARSKDLGTAFVLIGSAAALLVLPTAISAAHELGANPRTFAMMVCIAASVT